MSRAGGPRASVPRLGALAVLVHDENALLVRRRNPPDAGLWGYPGGHVELGEPVAEAAMRELHEETGVTGQAGASLPHLERIERDAEGLVLSHFLLIPVLCRFAGGVPEAQDDVSDARWVAVADVFDHVVPMSADVDTVLRQALAGPA
ncbi:ADP-ribose pyrophosphatase YjhB, NUDIX family [Rhodovulum sp. ES.010]|uniref:NUDIX hydrolase n=1 Tax=Rhodovulum sp. ES.010 TaxID=1882821 RepID=UPI00092A4399|nr:NUDIX hydrolase [Rhodovulum sp. ES.010]SIO26950.1 ADP-ribose pyrophosphatase YjhB, NUDIX family [Rhodovulum sp. ES.010]